MNDSLFSRLLKYYNITENEYFDLTSSVHENDFLLGHTFKQIEEAIMLVRTIMKQNGKILIYGDYDADGVMGTSILVKMFQYENYDVDFYLPNRYEDGYGLTLKKAQEAIDNGVSLVIMVDNGISAFEPISLLKKNDVSTIVIDHHQPQECLPEANHIVHYLLSDFGDVPTSGAFTAFVFSLCFLNRYDKIGRAHV